MQFLCRTRQIGHRSYIQMRRLGGVRDGWKLSQSQHRGVCFTKCGSPSRFRCLIYTPRAFCKCAKSLGPGFVGGPPPPPPPPHTNKNRRRKIVWKVDRETRYKFIWLCGIGGLAVCGAVRRDYWWFLITGLCKLRTVN